MQLTPRYDGPPVLRIDAPIADPSVPMLRQRRRLAEVLAGLDEAAWATLSRCDGWSVQDVVAHLVDTNGFWALSITLGRAGTPARFLATFDPVTTPAELVAAARSATPDDTLARFVESNEALADALDGMDESSWDQRAEAPPGHVALRAVVLHALWDGWIHERDVLLPLGHRQVEEPDEVSGALTYAAALGPAFLAATGSERVGCLVVDGTDPDVRVVINVGPTIVAHTADENAGAARLTGRAVDLVEALSFRAPFERDLDPDDAWMLAGLAEVFDQARSGEPEDRRRG